MTRIGRGLNSQVFDIWVGSEPCRFSVHEHYLARSPKFKSMCTSAKLRSGKSKMANVLTLPKENPVDMAYIFEYLYFDTLDIAHADSLEEAKQLANLFTLGCRFQLDDLVKKVVVKLETSKISSQIPAMQYLTLMEGLYLEENYHDLDIYFSNIASNVIQNLEESDYPEFERMIGEGGPYAIALFKGFRIAFGHKSQKTDESNTLPEIKTDSVDEPKTKKPKLSPPDTSPKPSSFWENLSNEDKTLVRLRAQMDSWGQISDTLEKTTGEPHPVNKLINRYNLIIRESDVSFLSLPPFPSLQFSPPNTLSFPTYSPTHRSHASSHQNSKSSQNSNIIQSGSSLLI